MGVCSGEAIWDVLNLGLTLNTNYMYHCEMEQAFGKLCLSSKSWYHHPNCSINILDVNGLEQVLGSEITRQYMYYIVQYMYHHYMYASYYANVKFSP